MKPFILALVFGAFAWSNAKAHSAYTPEPGSAERKEIMNTLRASLYAVNDELKASGGVVFTVKYLVVDGDWACAHVIPTRDGRAVGEPGWALLQNKGDGEVPRWTDLHYFELLQPYADDAEGDDALNMGPATVKKLIGMFPEAEAALPKR